MTQVIKTKEIAWTLSNGKTAKVEIRLEVDRMPVTASVDGATVGYGEPQPAPKEAKKVVPGAAGIIGRMIIMQAEVDKINEAIDELKATQEWQSKLARDAKVAREAAEYDAHRRAMRKAMSY